MTGRSLSAEERVHARRALLFLAERSAPARLAEALGLSVVALQKARAPSRVVGRRLAARVASVAGVDLADVLSGAWPGDLCPRCGRWGGASHVAPPSASTTADEGPLGQVDRPPADLAVGGAP